MTPLIFHLEIAIARLSNSFSIFCILLSTTEDSVNKVSLTVLCVNADVPPNLYIEALSPNVTMCGDESCVEVIKVK